MIAIEQRIREEGWTQTEAAARLHATQPRVSDLLNGKVSTAASVSSTLFSPVPDRQYLRKLPDHKDFREFVAEIDATARREQPTVALINDLFAGAFFSRVAC
jgi:hypothetical protein